MGCIGNVMTKATTERVKNDICRIRGLCLSQNRERGVYAALRHNARTL